MSNSSGSARLWWGWSVGLAGLGQLALFAFATGPGLAGTSDSEFYLHAATTLRTVGRLLNPDGTAYRYWPPLYPALLALGGSLAAARLLHSLALIISLFGWSWLGRRLLPVRVAAVLPWALALSTPWLVVSKFVWGETVFLALFAGYACALLQWLRAPQGRGWLLVTALGILLPLQRTGGLFLLAGLAAGLFLERKELLSQQRWPLVGHFAVGILAGLGWHYYALLVAAPGLPPRIRGWAQVGSSLADYGFVLSRWLLPGRAAWRPELPGLWVLGLVLGLIWLWPRRSAAPGEAGAPELRPLPPWAQPYGRVLWVGLTSFIILLIIATTFTRSASGLHDSERYASVLWAPVMLLALSRVDWLFISRNQLWRWVGRLLVVGWLVYAAGRVGSNAISLRRLPVLTWPRPLAKFPLPAPTSAAPAVDPGIAPAVR